MRRLWIVFGIILASLVGAALVHAQLDRPAPNVPPSARTITMAGSATVRANADSARLFFGVESSAKTVPVARTENAKAVKNFQEAVAALNVNGLRVRTTTSGVRPVHPRPTSDEVIGYVVYQSFALLITEPDPEKLAAAAERVLDAALQNGANAEGGIFFFLADDAELKREATRKAVEDALALARSGAAGAKAIIAEVIKIENLSSPWDEEGDAGVRGGLGNPFMMQARTSITAGAWEVTMRVRIVCCY
jgi:uncharacterized protein